MARRVYFAFHYQSDIWRVNEVRNSWVTQPDRQAAGFYDASLWEEAKKEGELAIQRLINKGLENTTVTVFLLGTNTADRRWVKYELEKSYERGNGLLAIYIHQLKDRNGNTCLKGHNILDKYHITDSDGKKRPLSEIYETYDWVSHDGYNKMGNWVETAAKKAGN